MKKNYMITIALEIDIEKEIENLNDIDYTVNVESQDAKMKVIDIPEAYEFTL